MLHEAIRALALGTLVFVLAWASAWLAALPSHLHPGFSLLGSVLLGTGIAMGGGWLESQRS